MAKVVFIGPGSSYTTANGMVIPAGGSMEVDDTFLQFYLGHPTLEWMSGEEAEKVIAEDKELTAAQAALETVTIEPLGPVALLEQERTVTEQPVAVAPLASELATSVVASS